VVLAGTIAVASVAGGREQQTPLRKPLVLFPDRIGNWAGHQGRLETDTLRTLDLSDYVIADYSSSDPGAGVNFYVAYYENQHQGASVHSPEVCIPAGGWEIGGISRREFPFSTADSGKLTYNRVIIRKGLSQQLVYYWFQQRGRTLANEFHMKWYIFLDAIRLNRTDGALVRLTTPIRPGESEDDAERRLQEFAYQIMPVLPDYVPD
jgi:EpsI family protein